MPLGVALIWPYRPADPMAGATEQSGVFLTPDALAQLMPMHLVLDGQGRIIGAGPTLAKIVPEASLLGALVGDIVTLRRPSRPANLQTLQHRMGERLHLALVSDATVMLRGHAIALPGAGVLMNLSFGIGVAEAVRRNRLTDADFAATDLAVEMLYLDEAKSAVVEEWRSLNQRLQGAKVNAEEQALTDTLTGLRNRRALDSTLQVLIAQRQTFGLMHLDLDYFKQVNDTLGHAAGDQVLRSVAAILREETRSSDTVARVGGDEFIIILNGLTDVSTLRRVAERIIQRLRAPVDFEGQPCQISGSIGLNASTHYAEPAADRMLSDADAALYRSKHAGRGCVSVFEREPQGEA